MMHFGRSSTQEKLRQKIIDFSQQELGKDMERRDDEGTFDQEGWNKCGEHLLPGLVVPQEWGGMGLTALDTLIALEALGYGSRDHGLNFAIAAHLLACVVPIVHHGSTAQKEKYLPLLSRGEWMASNAMTEPTSGSDAFQLQTTAVLTPKGYTLNGVKSFAANAPLAQLVLTYAVTNPDKGFYGGITPFLLEQNQHHYQCTSINKTGLRTCSTGKIEMTDTLVTEDQVLNQPGSGGIIFTQSMEWERICLGAIHLGAMQRLLEQTITYVKRRKSGGQPIGKYQSISHQLADMQTQLEAAKLLSYRSAWKLDQKQKVAQDAAMTKLMVSELYKDMSVRLVQIYASTAYERGHEVERNLRDALSATLYSGTSEVMRNIVAARM